MRSCLRFLKTSKFHWKNGERIILSRILREKQRDFIRIMKGISKNF